MEIALLSADLGVKTTREILDSVKEQISRNALNNGEQLKREIKAHVFRALNVYGNTPKLAGPANGNDPRVIFIIGVNGAGKTTSIGKLANRLRQDGRSVVLCAADTFRAAAIEQLEIWANRNGVELVKQKPGSDPAAVVYDAMAAAKARYGATPIRFVRTLACPRAVIPRPVEPGCMFVLFSQVCLKSE